MIWIFRLAAIQPGVHVLSWHMDLAVRNLWLAPAAWGSVNNCHFHKATDVAYGYENLLATLELRFGRLRSGEAYTATFPGRRAA